MLKRVSAQVAALVIACMLIFVFTGPTSAQKPFLERIRKKYALDKTNGTCQLCHEKKVGEEESRKNLNALGKAIQADPDMKPLLGKEGDFKFTPQQLDVVEKIVAKLEIADTDNDGATNIEELELGTYPSDAKSMPDKLALKKYREKKGTAGPATKTATGGATTKK